MKRASGLIKRNLKESLRDPLTLCLGAGLPAVLLLLFSVINNSVTMPQGQPELFPIKQLVPGIAVFGYAMLMMLSGTQLTLDRSNSFFTRLQTLPLSSLDFIVAYSLPYLLLAVVQTLIAYLIGLCLGLTLIWGTVLSVFTLLPVAVLFIALGIIMGTTLTSAQIPALGNVIIFLVVFLSGAWVPFDTIGGAFKVIAYILPFAHGVDAARELILGQTLNGWHFAYTCGYMTLFCALAVLTFKLRLKNK